MLNEFCCTASGLGPLAIRKGRLECRAMASVPCVILPLAAKQLPDGCHDSASPRSVGRIIGMLLFNSLPPPSLNCLENMLGDNFGWIEPEVEHVAHVCSDLCCVQYLPADAHRVPIATWALAVLETWLLIPMVDQMMTSAIPTLRSAKLVGAVVKGPAAAVVATAARIGWQILNATQILTDVGHLLDLSLVPPKVIAEHVFKAVESWR